MLNIIKYLLLKFVNDIDAGNSNLDERKQILILHLLLNVSEGDKHFSKRMACDYLGVSRATFDNYVRYGWIPKGNRDDGFKEKYWLKYDLDKFIEQSENSLL